MESIQLSVVHRLPQSYRWLSGFTGVKVEPLPFNGVDEDNNLIGLKLLSHEGTEAWQVMQQLNLSLQEIQVDCAIVEWEGALPVRAAQRRERHHVPSEKRRRRDR